MTLVASAGRLQLTTHDGIAMNEASGPFFSER